MFINNFIVIVLVLLFIVNEYKKNIELNKRLDKITKENFTSPQSSIDAVSVSNLATLATNLISNNGKRLNLEYSSIRMMAFRGMICPFYVSTNPIPKRLEESFWFLCDGKDDRPNLMGRFIYGGLNFRDIGGEERVTLNISEIPSHNHKIPRIKSIMTGNKYNRWYPPQPGQNFDNNDNYFNNSNNFYNSAKNGGGQSHNNMPPYMVMAYFIYLP